MTSFKNAGGGDIIIDVAKIIVENKAYLSEIDGKIGDGDHGVNMAKGFGRAADRLADSDSSLDEAMSVLSDILMSEIGGSMGPLYGMMFADMAECIEGQDDIDAALFLDMLTAGVDGVQEIGGAKLGDKTLLDCLIAAKEAFAASVENGETFDVSLEALKESAVVGRDGTIDMIAKIGRAARLGERSRGVVDAGATSCCLILNILSDGVLKRL
ncbi:MAG: dihydroxyacetone kinase subunit L [Alphaproteobacteria bacterium]|nr:dihydroxyacetone kinase subunit L [Alphaproteobacteria bacterium]